ncbi:unnamed protein product [Ilex paraguariensis]|uniref:Uncharacterized protein n=1 Tax=Ilex paraguariensis TaxID=185542 RepID=A0ABC8THY4_9AQUA
MIWWLLRCLPPPLVLISSFCCDGVFNSFFGTVAYGVVVCTEGGELIFDAAKSFSGKVRSNDLVVTEVPPPSLGSDILVCCNGAFNCSFGTAAYGVVVCTKGGELIFNAAKSFSGKMRSNDLVVTEVPPPSLGSDILVCCTGAFNCSFGTAAYGVVVCTEGGELIFNAAKSFSGKMRSNDLVVTEVPPPSLGSDILVCCTGAFNCSFGTAAYGVVVCTEGGELIFNAAKSFSGKVRSNDLVVTEVPPPSLGSDILVCCNGAFNCSFGTAAYGVVVCTKGGELIFDATKSFSVGSSLLFEAEAVVVTSIYRGAAHKPSRLLPLPHLE